MLPLSSPLKERMQRRRFINFAYVGSRERLNDGGMKVKEEK
jgi:hypothetical protein